MKPEDFITFAESIRAADDTGSSGEAQTYFSAILVGYHGTSHGPPPDEKTAQKGYSFGCQLRKRLK